LPIISPASVKKPAFDNRCEHHLSYRRLSGSRQRDPAGRGAVASAVHRAARGRRRCDRRRGVVSAVHPLTSAFDDIVRPVVNLPFNASIFLVVFLPLLLFHAALTLDVREIAPDWAPILTLAIVAVFAAAAAIGFSVSYAAGIPLTVALLLARSSRRPIRRRSWRSFASWARPPGSPDCWRAKASSTMPGNRALFGSRRHAHGRRASRLWGRRRALRRSLPRRVVLGVAGGRSLARSCRFSVDRVWLR